MRTVLASDGIGNATVDTVLPGTTVTPGKSVEAEVRIDDGEAEQAVDRIELEFVADPGPDALDVHVEVDRRGGLLSEVAETDESRSTTR